MGFTRLQVHMFGWIWSSGILALLSREQIPRNSCPDSCLLSSEPVMRKVGGQGIDVSQVWMDIKKTLGNLPSACLCGQVPAGCPYNSELSPQHFVITEYSLISVESTELSSLYFLTGSHGSRAVSILNICRLLTLDQWDVRCSMGIISYLGWVARQNQKPDPERFFMESHTAAKKPWWHPDPGSDCRVHTCNLSCVFVTSWM